ncbi:MAG TPA: GNAT family N-acetyltransferase [Candidatus Polarisedimenticolia bacterium]|jgi:GNAT superfamily N-acetyltransferase
MLLRDADPAEIDQILSHTHALWSDGLEPAAYREFIATLMASDWAKEGGGNYRFLVLADEATGEVAAATKLYRFAARLDGDLVPVGGVGAVFTLPHARRRGHAADLISQAHTIMAGRGDVLSLLYSEIGAGYYARLGYRELAPHAVRIQVPERGRPAAGLRPMHRGELDEVVRIREKEDAAASFCLARDHACWKYLLARASYPTLHLGREIWEKRLMLAEGGSGYLWAHFGKDHLGAGARLLEFGERAPGAALTALLDDLFDECRRRGVAEVEAWLPPALAERDPRLCGALVAPVEPSPVVPMWFPLDREAAADLERHASAAALHLTDVF